MRPGCSVRRQATVLAFVLLFAACCATTSRTTDDATLTTRVKIALLNDPQVGALRLDAKTFQRVVTLSGVVKTREQEQAALTAARTVSGVREVRSALEIRPQ